jgi:uncharacterized protein (TIGR03435 family)
MFLVGDARPPGPYRPDAGPDLTDFVTHIRERIPLTDQSNRTDAFQKALKKLGLQLEPRKVPVEKIVIDRLEETPTEN